MAKGLGGSRSVRITVGGGRRGRIPTTTVLRHAAMTRERQRMRDTYQRNIQGLDNNSIRALNEMAGGEDVVMDDFDDHAYNGPLDVDIGMSGIHGGEDEDEDEDTSSGDATFVIAVRDLIQSNQYFGKRYRKDGRTWKRRIRATDESWQRLMEPMTNAYVSWKYGDSGTSPSQHDYDFTISVIDIFTLQNTATIPRDETMEPNVALIRAGYLGNSPLQPSLAISLKTLELFYIVRLFKVSFSVEAFAKVLCYSYQIAYRRGYRTALSDAFDIYLAIRRKVEAQVSAELGHDTPNYRVLNSCPACCYELEDEPTQTFGRLWAVDGNNSLKRIKGINGREVADTRVFNSDYYLTTEFVDGFSHEVKSRPPDFENTAGDDNDKDDDDNVPHTDEGDPADGENEGDEGFDAVLAKALEGCAEKWKASARDEVKKMWAIFKESGVFVGACRHGFILWIIDMIESGELAKYPLAMVAKALELFGDNWVLGYDIGCRFIRTILSSSLGPKFQEKGCRTCVNTFHGYTHNIICQQQNHPLSIPGMGLEDLETLERIFSASNQLASLTRYMSAYRRRVFIDIYFRQWDRNKYQNSALMLHNNYQQALHIIDEDGQALQSSLKDLGITENDLDEYYDDEVKHFKALGKETEGDVHAVAYVELLQKFRSLSSEYHEASSSFRLQIPGDYTPLAPEQQYAAGLSETRRLETKTRLLREQRDRMLSDIVEMEVKMGIDEGQRWEPASPQYIEALGYMQKRKYQQELEILYKLVVQRLFELHRLNLSQTGYKMRTHISQALQKRSQAIRNSVRRYNIAAVAIGRPTLDWTKVSHFSFLDEFNILQDTNHSVFEKPWAKANIREAMKRHRRVRGAHDEIKRCNVEIRRLHTSIVDEEKHFQLMLQRLEAEGSASYGPVHEYITRRRSTNRLLLEQIHRTYLLPGFTGVPGPGIRKDGRSPTSSSPASSEQTALASSAPVPTPAPVQVSQFEDDDSHDLDEDDDELTEGVGTMVDWVASLV